MKKKLSKAMLSLLLVLALLIGGASGTLAAGETLADVFPDAAFRAIIKTKVLGNASIADSALYSKYANTIKNYNPMFEGAGTGDIIDISKAAGQTTETGADVIKGLDVSDKGIKSLKGIERLVNLMALDCEGNELESLDLSKNNVLSYINCDGNKLKSLLTPLDAPSEFSMFGYKNMLMMLSCKDNELTSLDLSKNVKLGFFNCRSNKLSSLDLSKCAELKIVGVAANNLTSLTFSSSAKLQALFTDGNKLPAVNASFEPSATKQSVSPGTQTIKATASGGVVTLNGLTKAKVQNLTGATTSDYKTFKPTGSSFSYDYVVGPSVMKVTVNLDAAPVLIGDINKDGIVNAKDLTELLTNYGETGANASDLNGDLIVNAKDLTALLTNYGMHN